MRIKDSLAPCFGLLAVLSLAWAGAQPVQSAPSPVSLDVPERSDATSSLAASGSFVAAAWGATSRDGVTDVYAAISRDDGRTFSSPLQLTDANTRANLSAEQPPRVSLVSRARQQPAVVVTWTSKSATGSRLIWARSDDGGRSFGRPTLLGGTDAPGNRGWEATATDSAGRVIAVWLDHRELAATTGRSTPASGAQHQHGAHGGQHTDGAARAQLSKLVFARVDSPDSIRTVTGGVCYCCKTAVATGGGGAIYAAWRHVYSGNVRDIAFVMSRDGGRTFTSPARVSEDKWVLAGCPENGPAIAVDPRGRIHVVWPTLVPGETPGAEPTLALFHASSTDGQQFTPRQRVPAEGFPRHVDMAVDARGTLFLTWEEQLSGSRRVALARGATDAAGIARFVRQVVSDSTPGTNPTVTVANESVIVAWTAGTAGQTVLRTARLAR